jgi:hypothetical protein
VYFNGLGWLTFDPTQSSSDILSLSRIKEAVHSTTSFFENLFIVDPDGAKQMIFSFFVGLYNLLKPFAIANWYWLPFFALIAVGLFITVAQLRKLSRRQAALIPQNRIIADYLELSTLLGASALGRDPSSTSKEFQRKLSVFFSDEADKLAHFMLIYEQAAFSPSPPSPEDTAFADAFVASARKQLEEALRVERRR